MIKNETLSQSDCYMYISVRDYVNWTPIKAGYTLATKSTVSATKSTAINCRIQVVADLLPIPVKKSTVSATKLTYRQQSTLLPICCQFRQQSTFNKVDRVEFDFVASVYRA